MGTENVSITVEGDDCVSGVMTGSDGGGAIGTAPKPSPCRDFIRHY